MTAPDTWQPAGCTCSHLPERHEPEDYTGDGQPIGWICCIDGCPCGSQWRTM